MIAAHKLGCAAAVLVLVAAGACGGDSTAPPSSPFIDVTVQPSNAAIKVGETVTLRATVTGPAGISQAVVWRSLDDTTATVNGQGLVRAVAEGIARIRATWALDSEVYRQIEIQVTSIPIEEVEDRSISLPQVRRE